MANVVSTYGTTENFVKSALMGLGATEQDANGRYYLDGSMVHVELSNVIAEAIYIEEIFRAGQSVTDKYTTDREAGAVRIMLDTPFDFTSRTLGYGGRAGTPGNSGVINVNPPLLPTNDEIMVYLNQVNDQALLFPDLGTKLIPLDVMAKKIAAYAKSVVQDRSASTLAEIIAYNVFRALNDGDNLYRVTDMKAENAYAEMASDLNSRFDNGDITSGAYTYSTEGRTIVGRPSFINGAFSRKSGLIMLGGDLAQEMLKNYDLDKGLSEKEFVGNAYRGRAAQFHWQSAPDFIWTLAEKYLGLPAGALNNVHAIAVSAEATAMGKVVDLGVKIIDANEVRGLKAQPLNKWGHECFRKCQLIGTSTLTTDYLSSTLGFTATDRKYPVAPAVANRQNKVVVPIYGADGVITGYKEVAEGISPNGGNWQSGLQTVARPVANPAGKTFTGSSLSVTLTCATEGATIYYTLDGSEPTSASTQYSSAISLTETKTIKAIAVKAGMVPSEIMSETYTKSA